MGQVQPVANAKDWRMCQKNVYTLQQRKPLAFNPLLHLFFCKLVGAAGIVHRAAKAHNAQAVYRDNAILNACTPAWGILEMLAVVVSVDIQNGFMDDCGHKRHIVDRQVAGTQDQVDVLKVLWFKMIVDIRAD